MHQKSNTMKVQNDNTAPHMLKHMIKLMKIGYKQNGDRYTRCKTCMKQICVWKECNNEKQQEYSKQHYGTNKEQIHSKQTEHVECNVCKSLIMKCNMKRHQQTDM